MSFHEPAHLMVADTLNASLLWKVRERFGDYADHLLNSSQQAIHILSESSNLLLDGWVQDAGRSVVASAQDGNVIVKSPLVDGLNTVCAIAAYSEAGVGPQVHSLSVGSGSSGEAIHCAIAMQRIDGRYLHTSESPMLEEVAEIVQLAGNMSFTHLPVAPQFISLTDRLEVEIIEAVRRATQLGDTSAVGEMSLLAIKINQTQRPMRICHGDLDMRNVMHLDGKIMIIDPEPVIAPAEFDAAKVAYSTGIDVKEIAQHLGLDEQLTADLHRFFEVAGTLYKRVKSLHLS
ncbi:hypothetical protein GCM10009720_18200 [Yaniella flava]|uniref:Aminoglycoside phosphotransferase domain-containing protein n=1 Tax=Yaniella flava TaxID=287930 RepID=A0ABP5G2Z1_9MICC